MNRALVAHSTKHPVITPRNRACLTLLFSLCRFVDGITFLGGELYVNNVISNNLYRIRLDEAGKAGAPVQIWPDRPIKRLDGMRA
jgi:hypothetical protein